MFTSRSFVEKFGRNVPFGGKKAPAVLPWRILFWVIFGCGIGMILTAVILWLATFWKVSSVSVEGSVFHDNEYILETANIQEGALMLGFDAADVERELKEAYPILRSVKVGRGLDGHVTLKVTEEEKLYYTCHHVNYYLISGDGLKVLDVSATYDLYAAYGAMYIEFPEEVSLRVGKKIDYEFLSYRPEDKPQEVSTYEIETGTAEEEFAYVMTLVNHLEESAFANLLTGVDASDRYDVYFVCNGNIKVRLGKMEQIDRKLEQAAYLITNEMSNAGHTTVVDVSNPATSTLRENPEIELPWWCETSK